MSGSVDPAAVQGDGLVDALREAGFEAEYVELDGVDHEGIITPERAPAVVDSIFELAAATAR